MGVSNGHPVTFRAGRGPAEQPAPDRELASHPALILPGVILAADCSEFQRNIDAAYLKWSRAIIIRAAYGDAHDDRAWYGGDRRKFLHDNGVKYLGFYQYLVAGQDITAQARAFCRLIGTMRPGEDLYADIEEGSGNLQQAWRTWALVVHDELGWAPSSYSGSFFARDHGLEPVKWVASYGTAEPSAPHLWWQFTDAFAVPGIGTSDCSVFHGGYPDLLAHAYGGTSQPVNPPATSWTETLIANLTTLTLNDSGEDVKSAQGLLIARGYPVTADGAYGPATRAAVTAFQHAAGLSADGTTGPATWTKLHVR